MKTFLKHILPFLVGAAVGVAPFALAQDYIRFADMTGSPLMICIVADTGIRQILLFSFIFLPRFLQ